jgi:hypothetical protein
MLEESQVPKGPTVPEGQIQGQEAPKRSPLVDSIIGELRNKKENFSFTSWTSSLVRDIATMPTEELQRLAAGMDDREVANKINSGNRGLTNTPDQEGWWTLRNIAEAVINDRKGSQK